MNLTRRLRALSFLATMVSGLAFAGLAQVSGPAVALAARPAAASAVAGYVLSVDDGIVQSFDAYDSADASLGSVSSEELSSGSYQVTFAKMAGIADSAIVQVSTEGFTANTCSVGSWNAAGTGLQALVDCFTTDGQAAATDFSLVVTHPTGVPHGTFDYALNTRANTSGSLGSFQYNSAHKKNSVKFLGTGKYQLTLGGPKTTGTTGIVKLSPYGNAPGGCELVGWTGSASGELVNVDCFGVGHVPADRDFIVTYASGNSLLGINGQVVANAFANGKAGLYQPAVQYDSVKGARVTVVHLRTGLYEVYPAGSSGNAAKFGGDFQLNAVGTRGRHCILGGWENAITPSAQVECFDVHDDPTDSPFAIEWVVP